MKRITVVAILFLSLVPTYYGQTGAGKHEEAGADLQKQLVLSDLKALEVESLKLDRPVARALASAEIADAAWWLDPEWAKTLLLEAYKLTFPPKQEQKELNRPPAGASRLPPTGDARAAYEVRARIFNIAGRDKNFAGRLAREGAEHVGAFGERLAYESLADAALSAGDLEEAADYAVKTFDADLIKGPAVDVINGIALQDRAAADEIIIKYLERLRGVALSHSSRNILSVQFSLFRLVFPNSMFPDSNRRIPPPGPEAMRAYVTYVIEALGGMERSEPGSLKFHRPFLLSAWLPLKQYAPELTPVFSQLEALSRRPGQDASLPTQSYEERDKELHKRRIKEALDSDFPDDRAINTLINRGDFDNARKAIDKLPDGAQKARHVEKLNASESLSLAAKGDLAGAARLAEKLVSANSILRVYPVIVRKCSADRDQGCATSLVYQAMKQLKAANVMPAFLPGGVAPPIKVSAKEYDPFLLGLSRLAKAVTPINEVLALEVLDELALTANRSQIDTGQGRTGFETDVFKALAQKNETRVLQTANSLKDRLHRIAALAAVYQWKAEGWGKGARVGVAGKK